MCVDRERRSRKRLAPRVRPHRVEGAEEWDELPHLGGVRWRGPESGPLTVATEAVEKGVP